MDLADQSERQRKTFAQSREPVVECRHVVGDLDDVIQGNARRFVEFEQQQI